NTPTTPTHPFSLHDALPICHYQFEAIHPFTDGNGRTGRVLNSLFLIQENLLTLPILYLSRYIIQHKTDYYRLLQDVTRSRAWERSEEHTSELQSRSDLVCRL